MRIRRLAVTAEAALAVPVCKVDGCDREPMGHGMCPLHYKRWWRHGDTGYERPGPGVRFFAKVVKTPTCWEWTGKHNWMGYGNFWFEGR
jgi:hypothetical protein